MVDFNQNFQNPWTLLGAGMMQGADPTRQGLGGLGFGLLNTADIMRQQEQLGIENERARQLADLQIETFRAKQAQLERARQQQEQEQAQTEAFAMTFPEEQRPAVRVNPQAFAQPVTPVTPKPYTEAAQIQADVSSGFLSPDMGQKLLSAEMQGGDISPSDRFKMEGDLNKRFDKNTQAFKEISNAYTAIQSLPETAIGDVALATKIMKLLDPGSVVRESELGVALGATGILDRLLNMASRAKEGKFLNEQQRREFRELAGSVYEAAKGEFSNVKDIYTQRALGYGLNPENVVYDYSSRATMPKVGQVVETSTGPVERVE